MQTAARSLGLLPATCLIVGEVIGIGIFLTPAEMIGGLRAPGLVYAMWLLAGVMALAGALCYGELATRFPEAGGAYVYLREAWGPPVAFLYGWKCLLVMDPGLSAALGAGLGEYAAYLWPLDALGRKLVAAAVILSLAILSVLGTRLAAGVLVLITALKVGLLATVSALAFASRDMDWSRVAPTLARPADALPLYGALAGGFVGAFFSFGGWWDAARMAGEVRDPQRTLPRAFVLGIAVLTGVYLLTSVAFLGLVPPQKAAAAGAAAAVMGERVFGPLGGKALAAGVVVSVVGALAAIMLSSPRVYVALARDGLFPERLARLHPRFGTPATAIAVQATLATLLVMVSSFAVIVAYFLFVTVAFIALSAAGLYRFPPPAEGFRTPLRAVTPAVFAGLSALLLLMLLAGRPLQALLGTAIVLLGLPVYALLRRRGALRAQP